MSSSRILIAIAACLLSATATAQEFRRIQPIGGVRAATRQPATTPDATGEERNDLVGLAPIEREPVIAAIQALFDAWNTPQLVQYLGAEFHDADRLLESLAVQVPRDAHLRILNVESINVISQTRRSVPATEDAIALTTTVSVVVRHQLEFDDPSEGFQAIEGMNEYVLDLTEVIPTW